MITADQSAIEKSSVGSIEHHRMTGAWRVIVARRDAEQARTWYYNENDDPRHIQVLQLQARQYLG